MISCDLGVACFSVHIKKSNVYALNGQTNKLADTRPERHPTKLPRPGPSHADSGSETSDEEMITENKTGTSNNEEDDTGTDMKAAFPLAEEFGQNTSSKSLT